MNPRLLVREPALAMLYGGIPQGDNFGYDYGFGRGSRGGHSHAGHHRHHHKKQQQQQQQQDSGGSGGGSGGGDGGGAA